jgi:beta-glucosidase
MVTLHHFSNPLWLVEKGDFSSDLMVEYFQRYVAKVVDKLGDLIPKWVTINEPMVYLFFRYLGSEFPAPKQRGWGGVRRVLHNMLRCHAAAYHTIKEHYPEVVVGVAAHIRPMQAPANSNALDQWWAKKIDWLFNDMWHEAMRDGRVRGLFGSGTIKGLAGTYDFIGINYYSRSFIRFPRTQPEPYPPDAQLSDMDFLELYPDGIFQAIKRYVGYNKPIYITENGLPDQGDKLRSAYLISHLREIWRAISFNFPVMGYYHWSLVDNFEWERGWSQRFGLIELDPETQARQWRPSAYLYAQICRDYALSTEMTEEYAPELHPVLFPGM